MNELDEFKKDQKELFRRIGKIETVQEAQKEKINSILNAVAFLDEGMNEKMVNLETVLSQTINGAVENIKTQVNIVHDSFKTVSNNLGSLNSDIRGVEKRQNDCKIREVVMDIGSIKDKQGDIEKTLGDLKQTVEPVKFAQRFPNATKYMVIGFLLTVILIVASAFMAIREVKNVATNQIEKVEKNTINNTKINKDEKDN